MRDFFKLCLKAPVKFYALAISPVMPPSCRFHPTCSAYALQAIEIHGPARGTLLTLRRVLKCHPWHRECGYDPVPEQKI